ncbi:hypothetical protein LAD12857_00860 [Lacrimispora amygdalina]|uniref:SpaA-like prealbumin fold domain-containing protein n=1 Tax=Lacrimispora amygdalina TaxID=253257 RepID=A0ABQ5LZH6_9FIRM
MRASYDEIPKSVQDEVYTGAKAFVKENKGRYECGGYIYSGQGQELGQFWAKLAVGNATLKKASSNTSLTDGNKNYSLAGATYGVYSDKNCTKQLATLTTDNSGNTETVEVKAGTVYIKELSAPTGFKVDKTVYSLQVEAGKTATLKVSDVPKATDISIELFKIDMETKKDTPQGDASLAGAVAGSTISGNRNKTQAKSATIGNNTSSRSSTFGSRAGAKVGAVLDTKNKVKDKASAVKEHIKDMPTQTAYAVHSAKENVKSSVSDFKRGIVQEQQNRQTGRTERQEQHRQSIADKRMALQKAQEARRTGGQGGGSATAGATCPHDRPVSASPTKQSQTTPEKKDRPVTTNTAHREQTPTVKERPSVIDTSRTGQPVGTRERPLSSREDTKPFEQKTPVQGQSGKRSEVQATQRERVNTTRQTTQQEQRTQTATATQQTRQSKKQSRQKKRGRKK